MSLRFRLNLFITSMFAGILLIGAVLVIHNARKAIAEELQSTANLTLQLLEVAFLYADSRQPIAWQSQLQTYIDTLSDTRHLNIEIRNAERLIPPLPPDVDLRIKAEAPRWFVDLVEPDYVEMRRVVMVPGMPSSEIAIRPDPADEITESWEEARSLLVLLLTGFVAANVIVYIGIGRSLRPIRSILHGLEGIEQGDYRRRLPPIALPELGEIARKFNRMAEVLESSRRENLFLAQRTLAIQEDERRRLAQELHDEMGQSISAIKAMSVSISQREASQDIKASASRIADICTEVFGVVRRMMRRLRPVVLDEFGLVPALQEMVDDWNATHEKASCCISSSGYRHRMNDAMNITVYRIAQECLTNAARHSDASEVSIELRSRPPTAADPIQEPVPEVLEMIVSDNGRGFDQDMRPLGVGLRGMRERVESLNGKFSLESSPGAGVRITIVLPLTDEEKIERR